MISYGAWYIVSLNTWPLLWLVLIVSTIFVCCYTCNKWNQHNSVSITEKDRIQKLSLYVQQMIKAGTPSWKQWKHRRFEIIVTDYTHSTSSSSAPVSRHQKDRTILDFTEAKDGGGISWTTCKSFALRSIQMTTYHINTPSLIFYGPDTVPMPNQCQSTKGTAVTL